MELFSINTPATATNITSSSKTKNSLCILNTRVLLVHEKKDQEFSLRIKYYL